VVSCAGVDAAERSKQEVQDRLANLFLAGLLDQSLSGRPGVGHACFGPPRCLKGRVVSADIAS
jgi:hypothetical protein